MLINVPAPMSREIRSVYPSLHVELMLSMRGKQADVDDHTGSLVCLTGFCYQSYRCIQPKVNAYASIKIVV